jgi:phage portal protein BeeE
LAALCAAFLFPAENVHGRCRGRASRGDTADELLYAPRNVRAHKAYGYSPVEQVQMSVNIALRRQIYQLQYYTEGNIPEALIGVPDNWNPDQISPSSFADDRWAARR